MSRLPTFPLAAAILSLSIWTAAARAQEPSKPKDDALDSLLEKLDEPKPSGIKAPEGGEKPEAKADNPAPAGSSKPGGDVAPKDQALDGLLEKLGETKETPAPDDRPRGGHPGQEGMPPPKNGESAKDEKNDLKKPEQELDRHLEELTGRKPKKSREDDDNSPLSQIVKEMREVEKELGKKETGEETRRKQAEIVKRLESMIEQLRSSSSQSQGRKRYLVMQPAKPGSKNGETPGAQAGNAPPMKPKKPSGQRSLAGGKGDWGHLPPELRQEMENVFKEEELPMKADLIRRYFLSLDKKYLSRGE